MKFLPLIGRILFTLHFLLAAPMHFSATGVSFAISQNVPMASFLVPFAGILAIAGGLSVLLGYKAKWGAWILIVFLIPVNFMMHPFWKFEDSMQQQMSLTFFLKDLSITGAAFLIAYFGAGPISIDEGMGKRSGK